MYDRQSSLVKGYIFTEPELTFTDKVKKTTSTYFLCEFNDKWQLVSRNESLKVLSCQFSVKLVLAFIKLKHTNKQNEHT